MADAEKAPALPKGLRPPGRALWRAVTGDWELRPDELRVLEQACRTLDDEARLREELDQAAVMTAGSMGQPRVSPLFAEVRATRALLAKLLQQLGLQHLANDEEGDQGHDVEASRREWQARAAAGARWRRAKYGA
ncbi:hypothetical protein [Streptomyces sp. UG1]|uniref:hypothetical protein n=1 Tax=Streptomyces sp. UG1 TaxID=3417652 RepID=UPI003CEDA12D